VAALLVNLNHVLQTFAPSSPAAAAAIPTVQAAVEAYAAGAFPQAFQLAQSAALYLEQLAAQARQTPPWPGS
jgi:ABC-type transporter Mla subunit MlaD